jgi:hypothetical protein
MDGKEIANNATYLLVFVGVIVASSAHRMLENGTLGQVTLCVLIYLALFSVGLIVAGRRMQHQNKKS